MVKTVRLTDDHIEAPVTIRPVSVAGADGRFVQVAGENFCITLTAAQARQMAAALVRMAA